MSVAMKWTRRTFAKSLVRAKFIFEAEEARCDAARLSIYERLSTPVAWVIGELTIPPPVDYTQSYYE